MKDLIRQRTVAFIIAISPVVLILAAADLIFHPGFMPVFLIFLGMAPMFSWKSRWYLLLPYSRKYLLLCHVIESVMLSMITSVTILLLEVMHYHGIKNLTPNDIAPLWIGVFWSLFRVFAPINRQNGNLPNRAANFKRAIATKQFLRVIIAFSICVAIFTSSLKKEPLILLTAFIFTFAFSPCIPLKLLIMPADSFRKWQKACSGFGMTLTLASYTAITAFSYVGDPGFKGTKWAFKILGRLPIPMSQERLLSVAMVPDGASTPLFNKIDEQTKKSIQDAAWVARTSSCKTSECLNVSDQLIPDSLPDDSKFERFSEIMKLCTPGLVNETYLRCKGLRLSDERLTQWLKRLNASQTVDKWLVESDPLRQFVAIRSLASQPTTPTQLATIKALQESSDTVVRTAARLHMTFYSPEGPKKESSSKSQRSTHPPSGFF